MILHKSFKIIKTISYGVKDLKKQVEWLELLKQCKFNRIHIPNFSYGVFENVLSIHMDYIKGKQISKNERHLYKDIIYEDLVCSTNPVSVTGYTIENFILGREDNKLYFIDLEDIDDRSIEERKINFKKDWIDEK